MATSPPCISPSDIEDSGLAYTSSVIAILTFCFAIGATIRVRVNSIHAACNRFADFKSIVRSFENESRWMRDLLHPPKPSASSEPQPPAGSRTNGHQRPSQTVLNSRISTSDTPDNERSDESRLKDIVEAVDDAENTAGRHYRSASGNCSHEKMELMRAHLLEEARKRKTISSVITELKGRKKEKKKKDEVYIGLLKDLEEKEGSLRDIVRIIEPEALSRTGTHLSSNSLRSQPPTRSSRIDENSTDVEMNQQNGTCSDTKVRFVARDTHVGTWRWWVGFDIEGNWIWPKKRRMAKYWQQSRENAMVLKEQRAALSSQVMFAQLAIVQSQIADRVLSDSADSQLIREIAKLRDELTSQENTWSGTTTV